jgi:hypothetical protein
MSGSFKVKSIIGSRSKRGEISPEDYLMRSKNLIEELKSSTPISIHDFRELKIKYSNACRIYYTAAAISRRKILEEEVRKEFLSLLFTLRKNLEIAIFEDMIKVKNKSSLFKTASGKTFFGVSAKQGVSIRYPLMTCSPTKSCGGRCYAHDGRDRELNLVFRSLFNYYLAFQYQNGSASTREEIIQSLSKSFDYGIKSSKIEMSNAKQQGFIRKPRIRFSHIGDMVFTPDFTNRVAEEIKKRDEDITCVIYTRRKEISKINPTLFKINFTIDSDSDSNLKFATSKCKVVSSAWEGELSEQARVNFLEHHVEKVKKPVNKGIICPVTLNHSLYKSCDEANCDICFN